jgi:hypothetical protein
MLGPFLQFLSERGDYEGFTLKTLERIAEATKTELVIDFRRTGS